MKLRIARHTNDLERIKIFYTDVLGSDLLGSFENHDNYNGIFIGRPNSDWHFEFTQSDTKANHFSDEDDITALYPQTIEEYNILINKLLHYKPLLQKTHIGTKTEKCFLTRTDSGLLFLI